MQGSDAAELTILICCFLALFVYSVLYFRVGTFSLFGRRYANLYSLNKQTRREWVVLLSQDTKEGINAVQTVRNLILAVSILAAATAGLASTLIQVLTDTGRQQRLADYARVDPISDGQLLSSGAKLGIALGILFLAIMAFAQSIRLAVHVGFTVRVVASDPARYVTLMYHCFTFLRRSSLYFAIGLKLIFATAPVILYVLGPTAFLIATLLDLAAQFLFDVIRVEGEGEHAKEADDEPSNGCSAELAQPGG